MRLAVFALLLAALPARAQSAPADVTPEAALSYAWSESLGGALAVANALDDVAVLVTDDTADPDDLLGDVRGGLTTAALGSAATAGGLTAALQFSVALADAAQRAQADAALTADVLALGGLLVATAEEAMDAAFSESLDEIDESGASAQWAPRAAEIRAVVGRLEGATAALGIAAP